MTVDAAYHYLFLTVLAALSAYACCGIIRAVTEKNTAGRVLGVNMTGSAVIAAIIVLTVLMGESYLADVAVLYVIVNFISVVILNRVFVAANEKDRKRGERKK